MPGKPEIEPSDFRVHGVAISTRYGLVCEIMEVLEFLQEAKKENLVQMLREIYYDSANSYCVFTPHDQDRDIIEDRTHPLFQIAQKYISQFEWAGEMRHSFPSEVRDAED